jgi:hypothetical protein
VTCTDVLLCSLVCFSGSMPCFSSGGSIHPSLSSMRFVCLPHALSCETIAAAPCVYCDCVLQRMLLALVVHAYSCRFGTFLFNCERYAVCSCAW